MKILLNDSKEIVGYVGFGDLSDSIGFAGSVPDGFEANFKPKYYMYKDNEIVVNPNYEEPSFTIPEPSGPSPEMLAINALGIQFAKHLAGGN